jgi:hypothetical protein
MKNKVAGRPFLPIVILFILICLFCLLASSWLQGRSIDYRVLLTGNGILFLATSLSFYFYNKALHRADIQAFLKMMYASLLLKMAFCIGATLLYLLLTGKDVSKYAILACFGLYILYTFAEVKILMGLSKQQKNA